LAQKVAFSVRQQATEANGNWKEIIMAQEIKKQEPTGGAVRRYWDPFAEMRADMDRVFDNFLGRRFGDRPNLARVAMPEMTAFDVDIRENDKELVLEAELPGMDAKDINIMLRDGVLSLKGEKKSERDEKKETYHLVERSYGAFERSFQLPDTVNEDQIKADFEKGVLRIVMPKRPEVMKAEKKIPIGKT
jgi:HSP20 family protein